MLISMALWLTSTHHLAPQDTKWAMGPLVSEIYDELYIDDV